MKVSEADCNLVLRTAAILGVELESWQEVALQHMYRDHRQRPADESEQKLCGLVSPFTGNPCILRSGHSLGRPLPHRYEGGWF